MNGSAATGGVSAIRAIVSAFGRFTSDRPPRSGERLQHHLAHGLQRLEDAVALERDALEVRGALEPFAARKLLDEVLAGVIGVRRRSLLCCLLDFPPWVERPLELANRRGVGKIAFVEIGRASCRERVSI